LVVIYLLVIFIILRVQKSKKVVPRLELGLLDSESNVLTN
jgi:hypothetical protein